MQLSCYALDRRQRGGARLALRRSMRRRWLAWLALAGVTALPLVDVLVRDTTFGEGLLTLPGALRLLGVVSGALGIGLLVAVIALGLRSPLLERLLGPLDRSIRVHHGLGVAAYVAILTHPLALALAASASSWRTSARMLFGFDRPEVALGWVSLVALVLVVCFSFFGRSSHERWRRIHALGWLAGGLGIAHVIAIRGLRATDVVLAGVLLATAGAKVVAIAVHTACYRVEAVRHLTPRVLEVELAPVRRSIRFRPGQFVFARFHDPRTGWRCREYHPFTIASGLWDSRLRLTIKQLGDCTRRILLDLKEGALADLRGPFGGLFGEEPPKRQIWLAGGMGIAPFLSAARSLAGEAPCVDLFYCTRRATDAVYMSELEALAQDKPSLRVHRHVDEGEGLLTADRVLSETGDERDAEFFIAGPPEFSAALCKGLMAHNVAEHRIHSERFEHL